MAGVPLLANQLGATARLVVEFAWGADLTANPAGWTWTDVTTDVRFIDGQAVTISPMGRSNESTDAQPAGCTFQLKNQTGGYMPYNPMATNYPNLKRNTPVRVRVTLDGSNFFVRFQGYANGFTPAWDADGRATYVTVSASGSLRRLQQAHKALRSATYREFSRSSPTLYWPLEEGFLAGLVAAEGSRSGGAPVLQLRTSSSQPVVLAGVTPQPGCGPMPNFNTGGSLSFPLRGTDANAWTIEFAFNFGAGEPSPDSYTTAPFQYFSPLAVFNSMAPVGYVRWEIYLGPHNGTDPNGLFALSRFDNGTGDFDLVINNEPIPADFNPWDGLNHHMGLRVVKNGTSVDWYLYIDGAQYRNGTLARAYTVADNAVANLLAFRSTQMPFGIGHVLFHDGAYTPPASHGQAVRGWSGETADARLTRLLGELNIPFSLTGTSPTIMGPQDTDPPYTVLGECETADLGLLYDGQGAGLSYICRSAIYNESAALTIDANAGQVPVSFAPPADDDQRNRNLVRAQRKNGGLKTFEDSTSPLGTGSNGIGTYDADITLNIADDGSLIDHASFRVYQGTIAGLQYPNLYLDFAAAPELASGWLAASPGERIDVSNLSSQLLNHPPGIVNLLLQGYTETLSKFLWRATSNCSPYRAYEVFSIQDTRLGRIETDGSTLGASATSGAASLTVASSGTTWDTSSPPFDIEIEGEQITVTAISGSSSPQTFTVTRSVNGVVKAHGSGAAVKLWRPGVLAL